MIPSLGLCITLHDILSVGEACLHPGSAAQHCSVVFRLVIFRPCVGEVLTGTVVHCDERSVRISLGFFDEIHVPAPRLLQENSSWNAEEKLWVWNVTEEDQLFLDLENPVRFRVEEVVFRQPTNMASARQAAVTAAAAAANASRKGGPPAQAGGLAVGGAQSAAGGGAPLGKLSPVAHDPSMQIIAGLEKSGLGLLSWWQ